MLGMQRVDDLDQPSDPAAVPIPGRVRAGEGSDEADGPWPARCGVACMASASELMALRARLAELSGFTLVHTGDGDEGGTSGEPPVAVDLLLLGGDWRRAGRNATLVVADRAAHGASVHKLADFMAAPERAARAPADPEIVQHLLATLAASGREERVKRTLDLVLSVLGLIVTAPLFGLIALVVRLDSPGPIFFVQERLGRLRAPFRCVKFRTMCDGAELRTGPVWAAEDDPRITRVGRVLRRSRLDELPQLINVVWGEMSLVGPRPIRACFADQLAGDIPLYDARFLLQPGLTGWAQVNDKYVSTHVAQKRKFSYEYYYIRNRSIPLDLFVLLMTIWVMVKMKGG